MLRYLEPSDIVQLCQVCVKWISVI